MTTLFILLSFFTAFAEQNTTTVSKAQKAEGLLVVIDRSGSMSGTFGNVQSQVQSLVSRIPKDEPQGMIHFSGCDESDVVYEPKFAVGSQKAILATVNKLEAGGATALALAIQKAYTVLQSTNTCPQFVLFTDGGETCGGDPVAALTAVRKYCEELNINVITSAVDETTLELYEKLTKMGKGKVYKVDTSEDGAKAVDEIIKTTLNKAIKSFSSLKKSKDKTDKKDTEETAEKKDDDKKREKAKATSKQSQEKSKDGDKP